MFEFESCREWNVCVCCVVYSGWERVCDLAPARSINTYHDAATASGMHVHAHCNVWGG